jgi:hypothetical protein
MVKICLCDILYIIGICIIILILVIRLVGDYNYNFFEHFLESFSQLKIVLNGDINVPTDECWIYLYTPKNIASSYESDNKITSKKNQTLRIVPSDEKNKFSGTFKKRPYNIYSGRKLIYKGSVGISTTPYIKFVTDVVTINLNGVFRASDRSYKAWNNMIKYINGPTSLLLS